MTRPMDRKCDLKPIGKIDHEAGEFWVSNPFKITQVGKNLSAYERNKVYLNMNGESFLDASFASQADIDSDSRGVMIGDFDNDGAPDLLVSSAGGGTLRLFLNRMPQGNRVHLSLEGTKSNRTALGARVIAECGEKRIVRDLFTPNGFMGQGPAELSLGLGDSERIDRLTIRWPTGRAQVLKDIPAGDKRTVREER